MRHPLHMNTVVGCGILSPIKAASPTVDSRQQIVELCRRLFLRRADAYDAIRDALLELDGPGAAEQLPGPAASLGALFESVATALLQRFPPGAIDEAMARLEVIASRQAEAQRGHGRQQMACLIVGDVSAAPAALGAVYRRVRDLAGFSEHHLALIAERASTPAELTRLLVRHQPRILHLLGDDAPPAGVCLRGPDGVQVVPPALLVNASRGVAKGVLRVIFMEGCFEQRQASLLSSRAPIVGVMDGFPSELGQEFDSAMYSSLFAGCTLDDAIHVARAALGLEQISPETSPQVVVRQGIDLRAVALGGDSTASDPEQPVRVLLVFDRALSEVDAARLQTDVVEALRVELGEPAVRGLAVVPGSLGVLAEMARHAASRLDELARAGQVRRLERAAGARLTLVQIPHRTPARLLPPPRDPGAGGAPRRHLRLGAMLLVASCLLLWWRTSLRAPTTFVPPCRPPDAHRCAASRVERCTASGWTVVEDCTSVARCEEGRCVAAPVAPPEAGPSAESPPAVVAAAPSPPRPRRVAPADSHADAATDAALEGPAEVALPPPARAEPDCDGTPPYAARVTLARAPDIGEAGVTWRDQEGGRTRSCDALDGSTWGCAPRFVGAMDIKAEALCASSQAAALSVDAGACGWPQTAEISLSLTRRECDPDAPSISVRVLNALGDPLPTRATYYRRVGAARDEDDGEPGSGREESNRKRCEALSDGSWACGGGLAGTFEVIAESALGEVRERVVVGWDPCCDRPKSEAIILTQR